MNKSCEPTGIRQTFIEQFIVLTSMAIELSIFGTYAIRAGAL